MAGLSDMLPDERFLEVIIIVLLVYVIYKIHKISGTYTGTEGLAPIDGGYVGSGLGNTVYTSGATMRRLAQKFSDPTQGEYMILHNAEIPRDQRGADIPVVVYPAHSGVGNVPAQGTGY